MILVDKLKVNYKLKFIDSTVFAHGLLLKKNHFEEFFRIVLSKQQFLFMKPQFLHQV